MSYKLWDTHVYVSGSDECLGCHITKEEERAYKETHGEKLQCYREIITGAQIRGTIMVGGDEYYIDTGESKSKIRGFTSDPLVIHETQEISEFVDMINSEMKVPDLVLGQNTDWTEVPMEALMDAAKRHNRLMTIVLRADETILRVDDPEPKTNEEIKKQMFAMGRQCGASTEKMLAYMYQELSRHPDPDEIIWHREEVKPIVPPTAQFLTPLAIEEMPLSNLPRLTEWPWTLIPKPKSVGILSSL